VTTNSEAAPHSGWWRPRSAGVQDDATAVVGRVDRLAGWLQPDAVCIIGLDGWRKVVDRRAVAGWQEHAVGGRPAYLMPNPSGLNAHAQVPDLAAHLRAAAAGPSAAP